MTKTEEVIKLLSEGKEVKEIKQETGVSDALISRCRKRLDENKQKKEENNEESEEEQKISDNDIDEVIKKIKITPEKKYLSSENTEENYRCMGCKHEWKATSTPTKCPHCGCEF